MTGQQRFEKKLYWRSFAARFLIGLTGWFFTQFADIGFLQDALYYEDIGAEVANNWLAGQSSPWLDAAIESGRGPWVMVCFLAVCCYVAGGVKVTPLAIGLCCLITATAPVYTYKISLRLGMPAKGARLAGWLVAFSPAFAFWSGSLYKEGFIMVVMNMALYHMLVLQEKWQPRSFAVLLLSILALFGLRFYLAIILGVVFGFGLLLGRARSADAFAAGSTIVRQLVLTSCFALAVIGIGFTDMARDVLPKDLTEGFERMQSSRTDLATTAASGYLKEAKVTTSEEAAGFLPVGLFYFMTVPWPWMTSSLREAMAMPETLAWVLMYPIAFMGMKEGLRRNFQGTALLILASMAIACFYALWIANSGAAYRLRVQVWLLLAVFIGWGWAVREARRRIAFTPKRL